MLASKYFSWDQLETCHNSSLSGKITGICMRAGQMEYMVPSIPLTILNPNLLTNCPMYNKQFSTTWFIRHIFISHTRVNTLNNCKRSWNNRHLKENLFPQSDIHSLTGSSLWTNSREASRKVCRVRLTLFDTSHGCNRDFEGRRPKFWCK